MKKVLHNKKSRSKKHKGCRGKKYRGGGEHAEVAAAEDSDTNVSVGEEPAAVTTEGTSANVTGVQAGGKRKKRKTRKRKTKRKGKRKRRSKKR